MDELDALFQQLQDVQEQQAALRLSERMVVDLVDKLKEHSLFTDELLHTTNGREYITPTQVKKEINIALEQCGGRVALVDLPGLLNVDYGICAAQASLLIKDAAGQLSLVNGDLFSETFFRNMATEVSELLRTVPALEINEIARQFALQADQVVSCLKEHLGSTIQGSLEGNTLYMPSCLLIAKSYLRGCLRAATSPVSISSVLKSQPFPHSTAVSSTLAATLVRELLDEGAVKGTFRTSGLLFTPDAFLRARIDAVQSFYLRQGYVEYSTVKNWGIPQPLSFLEEHCQDGMALHSVHANPNITAELDGSLEGGVPSIGFVDVRELLPNSLEQQDVQKLLEHSKPLQSCLASGACLVSGVYLVSDELLSKVHAVAKRTGVEIAEQDLISGKQALRVPEGVTEKLGAAKSSKGRQVKAAKGKGKKAAQRAAAASDEDLSVALDSMASIVGVKLTAHLSTDANSLPQELVAALSQSVASTALQSYSTRFQAGLSMGSTEEQDRALQEVNKLQQQAALHLTGLRTLLQDSGATAAANANADIQGEAHAAVQQFSGLDVKEQIMILEAHLCSSLLLPAADVALRYVAVHACGCLDKAALEGLDVVQQRQTIVDMLPTAIKSAAQDVITAMDAHTSLGTALEHQVAAVDALLSTAGVDMLSRHEEDLAKFVDDTVQTNQDLLHQPGTALATALSASVVSSVGRYFHVLVLTPGRSLVFIIRCLRKCMRVEHTDFLESVHSEVMQCLKRKQPHAARGERVTTLARISRAAEAEL